MVQFSLYDAKTHLSALVERAAAGEEVIIAKNGVPMARLGPVPRRERPRQPAHSLEISHIAADFDEPDGDIAALFGGGR